jgi:hypothetical protein
MSNVVDLTARRRAAASEAEERPGHGSAEVLALEELEALCAEAIEAGGLDAGGPTTLDFTVAVHRALKGSEWVVRFTKG